MEVQIVKRGRKFEGFTPEGVRVLAWAQQMLEDCERLKLELVSFREQGMEGPFNVGASPATITLASLMSIPFVEKAPAVKLSVETMPNEVLLKGLRAGKIDIAISYLSEVPEDGLAHHLLYREHMHLFSPDSSLSETRVTLQHVTRGPLCLLRSSLPGDLESRLNEATNVLWTDSLALLGATLATGRYTTVVPRSLVSELSAKLPIYAYPLRDPSAQANVGFITRRIDPTPALVHIWFELAHSPSLVKSIRVLLSSHKLFAKKPAI